MTDLQKMSVEELRTKFGSDIDLGDGYALEFFDELARRNKLLEKALKDSVECLRLFYQPDVDNKSDPSMQSVGRSFVKSEKALKQNRGG